MSNSNKIPRVIKWGFRPSDESELNSKDRTIVHYILISIKELLTLNQTQMHNLERQINEHGECSNFVVIRIANKEILFDFNVRGDFVIRSTDSVQLCNLGTTFTMGYLKNTIQQFF